MSLPRSRKCRRREMRRIERRPNEVVAKNDDGVAIKCVLYRRLLTLLCALFTLRKYRAGDNVDIQAAVTSSAVRHLSAVRYFWSYGLIAARHEHVRVGAVMAMSA